MALVGTGQRLLQYDLVDKIGEGGMGVVWRAVDTALGREVAIKIVAEAVATDTEHMARFEREARLLGSLNHPNIATIFGLHQADTDAGPLRFIAMELVPGTNLAQRLQRGPMPPDQALAVARQIAGALEAAHERGVVHRDLKPANVMLTDDNEVKVLDFGLAKSLVGDARKEVDPDSPTVTSDSTREGVVLGTATYMSPEQARGRAVDKRTDIWALGCIFFEMLTGVRACRGDSASDVLAEVLKGEPEWSLLPDNTPVEIAKLIRRCLVKSPRDRLHDVADARLILDEAIAAVSSPHATYPPTGEAVGSRSRLRLGPLTVAAIAALALVAGLVSGRLLAPSAETVQGSFTVELPEGLTLSLGRWVPFTLSPDGNEVVFAAGNESGQRLYRRRFDSFDVEPIPGTEGAESPSFSPDGRAIAFADVDAGQIKRIDAAGGAAFPLRATTFSNTGVHWGTENRIVVTDSHKSGLTVLSAENGEVIRETQPDREAREKTHRHPHLLPDGSGVLFLRGTADLYTYDDAEIDLLDLGDGTRRRLIEDGKAPTYVSSGHILFVRRNALLAAPFDLRAAELTGPIVEVLDGITTSHSMGVAYYATSPAGHLAYLPAAAGSSGRDLVFLDRRGQVSPSGLEPAEYDWIAVSPSGRKLALEIAAANDNVWVHDLDRGVSTRLTTAWDNENPIWTSDDRTVLYHTVARENASVAVNDVVGRSADGSGAPEIVIEHGTPKSWARVGGQLAFFRDGDIWVRDRQGTEPEPFLTTRFDESDADFTSDGRWLAFVSDESERPEVYVVPYPSKNRRWQVSVGGGGAPRWSFDDRELYYLQDQTMMVVEVKTTPEFSVSPPRVLFELDPRYEYLPFFDVFPDGRFVMTRAEKRSHSSFRVVLRWVDRLRDRL